MDSLRVLILIILFSFSPAFSTLSLAAEPAFAAAAASTEDISPQDNVYQVKRKGFGAEMPDDIGLFRVPCLAL